MNINNFEAITIDGKSESLEKYHKTYTLIVNVASKCGFTPQYKGLESLYKKYRSKGLTILGFPANDFLWQEPLDNKDIKSFCSLNYGVTFPLFEKIHVKGKNIHPLYKWLTSKDSNHQCGGKVSWNFTKFLIAPDGMPVKRFSPNETPESVDLFLNDLL